MASPLVPPKPAPPLNIPHSPSTVTVRVIDSTTTIHASNTIFMRPIPDGFKQDMNAPAYSFLISHGARHLLFDLGVRKDWWNLAPAASQDRIGPDKPFQVDIEKNVADILDEDPGKLGIKPADIEAIIWSHHHWDHTGNPNTFPKKTDVIVGPGFKETLLPFYPKNPKSILLEADVEGRNLREVDIVNEGKGLKLGRYDAMDFFGDGSFYLMSTPGHAPGHICGLARLTNSPATFIFMGGDISHHAGEFRPTPYLPLPSEVKPSPIPKFLPGACPGAILQDLQRHKKADESYFEPDANACVDLEQTKETVDKLKDFDADANILVVLAHDHTLRDRLDFYPKPINGWRAEDLDAETRWLFVRDFSGVL